MRKIYQSPLIAACFIPRLGIGQPSTVADDKFFHENIQFAPAYEVSDTISESGSIALNAINIRAVRDFLKSYKNASHVIWTELAGGFRVHFYSDDIQTRILYDKHGNRVFVIRWYMENKLPSPIRHLVRSTYYDFGIFCVTEVNIGEKQYYYVKIEDNTCWKTIRITDDEMEIAEEYLKK